MDRWGSSESENITVTDVAFDAVSALTDISVWLFVCLVVNVSLYESSLLLGDSMVVFHVRGERNFKPFLEKDDDLVAAILPIAGDALLVGAAEPYVPDVDLITCELVRCSLELFVASGESECNAKLSSRIGENAHILPDEDVREIVKALFKG